MRILVLNGSPSGKDSITLYTVLYLQTLFPDFTYEILHVGQQIKQFEKNFTECEKALREADLILFCYPVYTFLVPSQLHRFIELLKEKQLPLSGKYATQISTSLHFYDITAHGFIKDNCDDLGLKYIRGLSADMEDLLSEKGRKEAEDFFRFVLWSMEQGCYEPTVYPEMTAGPKPEAKEQPDERKKTAVQEVLYEAPATDHAAPRNGTIAVVADLSMDHDGTLQAMIAEFSKLTKRHVQVTNIQDFPFKGGCLGCFHCAADGTCVYKDGFDQLLRNQIQTADATVYAFSVKDHSMGYRFKLFDDRQFCNGHRTVTMGKPVGYLVDGVLEKESNLQTLIEARAQVGGNFLAGAADLQEDCDSATAAKPASLLSDETKRQIGQLAKTLDYAIDHNYQPPKNFYGVGGLKIFRDLIYQMRGLMKEDHRFYKKHGFYDFPQKRKGRIIGMYFVGAMMNNKSLSKKMGGKMTEGMIMPYQKALKEAKRRRNN